MKSRLFTLGTVATLIYVIGFAVIFSDQLASLPGLAANEVGDFFAGVFGPVAFLWLVLGFLQQGRELRMSAEALQQQARELKASVEQQSYLAKAATNRLGIETDRLEEQRRERTRQ